MSTTRPATCATRHETITDECSCSRSPQNTNRSACFEFDFPSVIRAKGRFLLQSCTQLGPTEPREGIRKSSNELWHNRNSWSNTRSSVHQYLMNQPLVYISFSRSTRKHCVTITNKHQQTKLAPQRNLFSGVQTFEHQDFSRYSYLQRIPSTFSAKNLKLNIAQKNKSHVKRFDTSRHLLSCIKPFEQDTRESPQHRRLHWFDLHHFQLTTQE